MKNSFRNHFDTQKKVSKRSNVDMTQKNIKRFFAVSSVNLLRFAKICQIVISFQYLQSKDMYSGVLPNVCPTKISLSICISSDKLGQQHVKIWVTRKVFLEVISKEGFFSLPGTYHFFFSDYSILWFSIIDRESLIHKQAL